MADKDVATAVAPADPSEPREEDVVAALAVLRKLSQATREARQSPRYRELRRALQPFVDDHLARFYRGASSPADYEQRLVRRRLASAEQQRARALDRNATNSRALRASRLEALRKLQTAIGPDGAALPLIPDGAAALPAAPLALPASLAAADAMDGVAGSQSTDSDTGAAATGSDDATLIRTRGCYVCKGRYNRLHFFYDSLCEACAQLNYRKRLQTADMRGYIALVTGGRVKIGNQIALKLLRAGATVIVTTRFPHDAALRFTREEDFAAWRDRLHVYGVDLRNLPSLERLCATISQRFPYLDVIINNACQTVRRPPVFFKHLMSRELEHSGTLTPEARALLDAHYVSHPTPASAAIDYPDASAQVATPSAAVIAPLAEVPSAVLSQLPLMAEDTQTDASLFPVNVYDVNQQQLDLRRTNSWLLKLEEVQTPEVVEVFSINAIAPFVLNGRLKPLMLKSPHTNRFIVNVSAMEGKFYRHKMPTHPHTNMAKAALNMMTRTSAADYAQSCIYMTAVDTGWINDENPLEKARDAAEKHNFQTPIDEIDAAARVLDPVFSGLSDGAPLHGVFLKDYVESDW